MADSTPPRRRYHHGDLRRALIETATEMLDEAGPSGLTLRTLASRIGVTHAAPYRHFRDKEALLDAIAVQGHRALASRLHRVRAEGEDADGDDRRLGRLATAFLDFAREHAALYRLMSRPAATPAPADDGRRRVLEELGHAIRDLQRTKEPPAPDHRQLACILWAELHGLAVLALDGVATADAIDALLRRAVETLRVGMLAH